MLDVGCWRVDVGGAPKDTPTERQLAGHGKDVDVWFDNRVAELRLHDDG
jgi:hypothetical protein